MWKYCEIYCVSITIYILTYINILKKLKKKKTITTVATMPLGIVVTVQNLGKEKKSGSRNQNHVATVL